MAGVHRQALSWSLWPPCHASTENRRRGRFQLPFGKKKCCLPTQRGQFQSARGLFVKKLFAACITVAAMCGATALAVAKPYKPVPPPPPPPVQSWTGFYVGGNAGYDWSQQTANYAPNAFIAGLQNGGIPGSLTQNLRGFTGGVQGGYNYQIGQELVGIEADFSGLTMNGTTASNLPGCFAPPGPGPCPALPSTTTLSQNNKLNWLSTLRGRLGLLSAPDLLLYATGGLAVGRVQLNLPWRRMWGSVHASQRPLSVPRVRSQARGPAGLSVAGRNMPWDSDGQLKPSICISTSVLFPMECWALWAVNCRQTRSSPVRSHALA